MASSGPSNPGWFTSLLPAVIANTRRSRPDINARPIVYLKVPDISFISQAQGGSVVEATVSRNGGPSRRDSDEALCGLAGGMSSLDMIDPDSICPKSLAPVVNLKPHNLNPASESSRGPIHFHRKPRGPIQDHKSLSTPSPLTPSSGKYTLSLPPARTDPADPHAHLLPGLPMPVSPETLRYIMQIWAQDTAWCAEAAWREEYNPFPTIHLREGWNLARCQGILWHLDHTIYDGDGILGSMEHEVSARQSLARFSFWAQREPMQFDEADDEDLGGGNGWLKMFAMVFKGKEGQGMCWAREPGSWRAARAGLLTCCRGVDFLADVEHWGGSILGRVQVWKESNEGWRDVQEARRKKRRKLESESELRNQPSDWTRPDDDEERRKRVRREGPAPAKLGGIRMTTSWSTTAPKVEIEGLRDNVNIHNTMRPHAPIII
ncbi:uncharacterized protein L3040_009127 [Drepanopeziza brunnea f. sp. 'multigermtubi']|uniref:uncharacterized protein n=1 Tax=Drepanopeziza brunnea f. sp. 'multigermtubi' TaxID=698441 RepID=UPI002397B416|nr:hypothetical protein L3040_009127 [Drepanopeziza brunnea f. sp. 'multigermtubi']